MTERTFVDTNVWVYAVDLSAVDKQNVALELLRRAVQSDIVVSAQVLGEFYAVVTRKFSREVTVADAGAMVAQLSRLPVVPIDARLVDAAMVGVEAWQLSYWDALIISAAEASGCGRVLSEDMTDGGMYGSVRVENPFRKAPVGKEGRGGHMTQPSVFDDREPGRK